MPGQKISMPENFDGIVRLFPLPNLVLFPGVIQALNIFEPRYRKMMEEALREDGLITMALLKPAQLGTLSERPLIFDHVCIGKILTHAKLDDGCYNLLLAGVHRARVLEEVQFELPFRKARVELVQDVVQDGQLVERLCNEILTAFREMLPQSSHLDQDSLESLIESNVSPGQLMDLVAYSCGVRPIQLQKVLAMDDVEFRARLILKLIKSAAKQRQQNSDASRPDFPPDFSLN